MAVVAGGKMCSASQEMMRLVGELVPFPRTTVAFYGTDVPERYRLIFSVMRVSDDVYEAKFPTLEPLRILSLRALLAFLRRPAYRVYDKVEACVFRGHVPLQIDVTGPLESLFDKKLHVHVVIQEDIDIDEWADVRAAMALYAWSILN